MALEDLLREAAARGLTHLSLHPVHSEDNKTVYWRCSATPSTMHKYVSTTTLDPVESVTAVLKAMPKAPKRSAKELTVAVKEPPPAQNPAWSDDAANASNVHRGPATYEPTGELTEWLPKT
jgi:hypothetical protein